MCESQEVRYLLVWDMLDRVLSLVIRGSFQIVLDSYNIVQCIITYNTQIITVVQLNNTVVQLNNRNIQ